MLAKATFWHIAKECLHFLASCNSLAEGGSSILMEDPAMENVKRFGRDTDDEAGAPQLKISYIELDICRKSIKNSPKMKKEKKKTKKKMEKMK